MVKLYMTSKITKYFKKHKSEDDMDIYVPLPMENMQESRYNFYMSQQLCSARDFSMNEYYDDNNRSQNSLQILYDIGCAINALGIVEKEGDGYKVSENFSDYDAWKDSKDIVKNCEFLHKMGHPYYK